MAAWLPRQPRFLNTLRQIWKCWLLRAALSGNRSCYLLHTLFFSLIRDIGMLWNKYWYWCILVLRKSQMFVYFRELNALVDIFIPKIWRGTLVSSFCPLFFSQNLFREELVVSVSKFFHWRANFLVKMAEEILSSVLVPLK